MYFLDETFFTGDIFIPNFEEGGKINLHLYKLITQWERDCLEMTLGKNLTEELISNLELVDVPITNPVNGRATKKKYKLKDNAEEKWKYLMHGRAYNRNDVGVSNFMNIMSIQEDCGCGSNNTQETHYWEGIVKVHTTPINDQICIFKESYLAYYVYREWLFDTSTTTSGVGEVKLKAKNAEPVSNTRRQTNAHNLLWAKTHSYSPSGNVGLYLFMQEHREMFPNFNGTQFKNINIYNV